MLEIGWSSPTWLRRLSFRVGGASEDGTMTYPDHCAKEEAHQMSASQVWQLQKNISSIIPIRQSQPVNLAHVASIFNMGKQQASISCDRPATENRRLSFSAPRTASPSCRMVSDFEVWRWQYHIVSDFLGFPEFPGTTWNQTCCNPQVKGSKKSF